MEKDNVRVALGNWGYPEWTLNEGEQLGKKQKRKEEEVEGQGEKNRQEKPKKAFVVLRYMKRAMERLQETQHPTLLQSQVPH